MPEDGCGTSCTRADVLSQLWDPTGGPQRLLLPLHPLSAWGTAARVKARTQGRFWPQLCLLGLGLHKANLMNSPPDAGAKRSCNLESNLHSPTRALSPQPGPGMSRKWSWAEASETSVGLNVHLCNTWSSGFYLYFFTAYRVCTRAPQITIY